LQGKAEMPTGVHRRVQWPRKGNPRTRRAGCVERCLSGSGRGSWKRTEKKEQREPDDDPESYKERTGRVLPGEPQPRESGLRLEGENTPVLGA